VREVVSVFVCLKMRVSERRWLVEYRRRTIGRLLSMSVCVRERGREREGERE